MNRTMYIIPGNAGPPLQIPATRACQSASLQEDDSVAPQGLIVRFRTDNFTQPYDFAPGNQPIKLGETGGAHEGKGPWLGWPAQHTVDGVLVRPADILCTVTSMGAATTKIRVEEFE